MKKILLIALACLLCFFAGYFAGIKSKPATKNLNYPYRMRTVPRRIAPKVPRMQVKVPAPNKLQNLVDTKKIPKPKTINKIETSSVK